SISIETYFKILKSLHPFFTDETLSPEEALKAAQERFKNPKASGFKRPNKSFQFSKFWERIIPVLFLRKLYGTHSAMALLLDGVYSDPKVFGFSFSLKGQSSLKWNDQELNPRLKAFLFQILQRKIGFTRGHRLNGILLEGCIAYFIVRWYTKTLAFLQEKPVCQLEDLTLAIRLTERYYTGHQPKFLEFFKKFPTVEILLVSLLGI
ncbi:MAG: hypothetical protein K2X66_05695, partial [Cyanobacteria bacterium]|nr:hypothetical protein [Cyanobacteriota bacterium]